MVLATTILFEPKFIHFWNAFYKVDLLLTIYSNVLARGKIKINLPQYTSYFFIFLLKCFFLIVFQFPRGSKSGRIQILLKILDFEWNDFRCGNAETMLNNDNVGTILNNNSVGKIWNNDKVEQIERFLQYPLKNLPKLNIILSMLNVICSSLYNPKSPLHKYSNTILPFLWIN
jgi:hypothetical protein